MNQTGSTRFDLGQLRQLGRAFSTLNQFSRAYIVE